jgi:hypothetical protein
MIVIAIPALMQSVLGAALLGTCSPRSGVEDERAKAKLTQMSRYWVIKTERIE